MGIRVLARRPWWADRASYVVAPEEAKICGRYLVISSVEALSEHFDVDEVRTAPHPPRYNVAPGTSVYAILESDGERRLGALRWGLRAPWAKPDRIGPEPINARVETVADSRLFGPSVERKRCILPADGFYEWQRRAEGRRKKPHHIAPHDGAPLGFAAIWSAWRDRRDPDAAPMFSTAILTTPAAGGMERIHDRMPVVLPPQMWDPWLSADSDSRHVIEQVRGLAVPQLTATPITEQVNNVRNDGPQLLEYVERIA